MCLCLEVDTISVYIDSVGGTVKITHMYICVPKSDQNTICVYKAILPHIEMCPQICVYTNCTSGGPTVEDV